MSRLVIGDNVHAGKEMPVSLSAEQRLRHTHIIGATGTGKSHLLLNLIIQDIEAGNGVAVLDPHGDVIDQLLPYIPKKRAKDVVLFDPADEAYPIGFNILSAHSTLEKQLLSSDLVATFRRLSTSWGDRMHSLLANATLAFLESKQGGTLADLRRFLLEKEYRKRFLATVADPEVVYFWQKEFPLLSGRPQAPLLTRLDTFLRPRLIRHIVAQKENRLDFARVVNEGKIFLGKLAQGLIGEENAYLLGTLLVSKFYQTALSRQSIEETERRPFYLYIDEFHHFITPSLSTILSGARKYALGLTLAHHDLRQLSSRDPELTAAVLTNPYTRICFRVGGADARKLESGFGFFEAKDLQNLGRGEAICRVERSDYDFNLQTRPHPALDPEVGRVRREEIIACSRETYGTPRAEVETLLQKARTPSGKETVRESSTDAKQEPSRKPSEEPPEKTRSPEHSTRPQKTQQEATTPTSPADNPTPPIAPSQEVAKGATPAKLGRGGRQHRYLQELIKRWAQANGWRATIEQSILDGLGSVDIALEHQEKDKEASVACEISVTSTPEHEFGNVQKCLAAGFDDVVVVSVDKKSLEKIEAHVTEYIEEKDRSRVHVLTPEALFFFLSETALPGTGEVVGGYNVEVRLRTGSKEEQGARRQAISHVILQALQRMREDSS